MKGPWIPNANGLALARRLRQLREISGLTQGEVGELLGGSAGKIHRIERRGQLPWPDELNVMLDLYKVSSEHQALLWETWDKAWQPRRVRGKRDDGGPGAIGS